MYSSSACCYSCCSCCSCFSELCCSQQESPVQDAPRKQPWLPCTSQRACCSPASAATALRVGSPAAAGAGLSSAHLKTPWLHTAAAGCPLGRAELMQAHLQEIWAGNVFSRTDGCFVGCPVPPVVLPEEWWESFTNLVLWMWRAVLQ